MTRPIALITALLFVLRLQLDTVGCMEGDEAVERLLTNARNATTWPLRFSLVDQIGELDPHQVKEFADRALRENESTRLLGVMAMSRLKPEGDNARLWKTATTDPSATVSRLGWIDALRTPGFVTAEQHGELLRSSDVYLRTAAALTESEPSRLVSLLGDESALVRTAVARRLGGIAAQTPDLSTCLALDVLLVDPSELVRANAIWACHQTHYIPISTLRGLILDGRPSVYLEVLLLPEPESRDLRERYGLSREYDWSFAQLGILEFKYCAPTPNLGASLGAQDWRPRIRVGTWAAAMLIESGAADSVRTIRTLTNAKVEPVLRIQLKNVLDQAERRRGNDARK